MSDDGVLVVRFPDVRWERLRATEGWAALQYHALLHSTFTVYPPSDSRESEGKCVKSEVELLRGSFFSIYPISEQSPLEWHAGNIYEDTRGQPEAILDISDISWSEPTTFHVLISGDYEVCGPPLLIMYLICAM